jgi:hypothetical protein
MSERPQPSLAMATPASRFRTVPAEPRKELQLWRPPQLVPAPIEARASSARALRNRHWFEPPSRSKRRTGGSSTSGGTMGRIGKVVALLGIALLLGFPIPPAGAKGPEIRFRDADRLLVADSATRAHAEFLLPRGMLKMGPFFAYAIPRETDWKPRGLPLPADTLRLGRLQIAHSEYGPSEAVVRFQAPDASATYSLVFCNSPCTMLLEDLEPRSFKVTNSRFRESVSEAVRKQEQKLDRLAQQVGLLRKELRPVQTQLSGQVASLTGQATRIRYLEDDIGDLATDNRPEPSSTQMVVPFGAGVVLTLTAMGGTVLLKRRRRPSRSPR